MIYLKFSDFGAYIDALKAIHAPLTHLDISDCSIPGTLTFFLTATYFHAESETIYVASELAKITEEELELPALKKFLSERLARTDTMFKKLGLRIRRGIYTAQTPEVLSRGK